MEIRVPLAGSGTLSVRLDEPSEPADHGLIVLYLHGFGSSQEGDKAELFRRRCLERRVGFCSFDFQGHGDSGGTMLDLSLSRNLDDLDRVRAELASRGYSRIVLFGSSMGGLTGLWYAAQHPDPITAAIHLAPALGLEEVFTEDLGLASVEQWEREGKLEIGHDLGTWDIGGGFVEDLRRHDEAVLYASYRTPTLIFQGKHDDSVPWRRVVDFTTNAAGEDVELHFFADGDHRLLDKLDRLWQLTEEFLGARDILPNRKC